MEREYYPCAPTPDCPYYYRPGGCFEDEHHLYQSERNLTKLERIYRSLGRNTVDTCRRFHEQVLDKNPLEYPDEDFMRAYIMDAEFDGEIVLSNRKRKVVYGRET